MGWWLRDYLQFGIIPVESRTKEPNRRIRFPRLNETLSPLLALFGVRLGSSSVFINRGLARPRRRWASLHGFKRHPLSSSSFGLTRRRTRTLLSSLSRLFLLSSLHKIGVASRRTWFLAGQGSCQPPSLKKKLLKEKILDKQLHSLLEQLVAKQAQAAGRSKQSSSSDNVCDSTIDSLRVARNNGLGNANAGVGGFFDSKISYALDSISAGQNIIDGQTIVSAGGNFELGFFSPGSSKNWLDSSGYPQLILRNRLVVQFRSGPWNGLRFSGFPQLRPNPVYSFGLVFNQNEIYYYFNILNSSVPSMLVLNENGITQRFSWFNENGQVIYVRMAASEVGGSLSKNAGARKSTGIIVSTVLSAVLLLSIAVVFTKYRRDGQIFGFFHQSHSEDLDLPLFDLTTIVNATNNFSEDNKLGEGGFGAIYKGVMKSGQEIAVKRLSENSRQGQVEFKNEVVYIILGCCIQVDEKMLIYEFLPNRSLDCFIFDPEKGASLDWPKRFTPSKPSWICMDTVQRSKVYETG
ncbi:hypothetical protein NL676_039149 [Syzygium grande]|nr:hypothetical protein NL676_039149 [Syzygium grande]